MQPSMPQGLSSRRAELVLSRVTLATAATGGQRDPLTGLGRKTELRPVPFESSVSSETRFSSVEFRCSLKVGFSATSLRN